MKSATSEAGTAYHFKALQFKKIPLHIESIIQI
jgi:hypothetical protein